jgi:hypothetical protein
VSPCQCATNELGYLLIHRQLCCFLSHPDHYNMSDTRVYTPSVFVVQNNTNKHARDAPPVRPHNPTKTDTVFMVGVRDTWKQIEVCPCFKEESFYPQVVVSVTTLFVVFVFACVVVCCVPLLMFSIESFRMPQFQQGQSNHVQTTTTSS